MKQVGKFILFEFQEFQTWLQSWAPVRKISIVQNHHTWQPNYKEWAQLPDPFHWLQSMEDYQVQHEGFAQAGQNLTTFPDGTLAISRPFDVAPAGAYGCNSNGLCIEHFGNFDAGGDVMNDKHHDTILKLNAALCKKLGISINTDNIIYHHWYDMSTGQRTNGTGNVKTCPGTNFFGGNSVQSAQANFIPLIVNALQTL